MIDYKKHDTLNLVELTIFGSITEDDFDRVTALLASDIQKHGKLRLLEEVRSFEGMDPITLWKDVQFSLQHINDFSHVAVVADAAWVRTFSSAMDNILAAQVQAFESSQIEMARTWLETATVPEKHPGMTYHSNDDNNIVEIVVEGKITADDFERVLPQMKSDLQRHGKVKVLEEIRSFEGMDPMALWMDLQNAYLAKDVTHGAIVADAQWIRTVTDAVGVILPMEVRSFEQSQIGEARAWLASL